MRAVKCEILGMIEPYYSTPAVRVAIYWRRWFGLLAPKRLEYAIRDNVIICEDGRTTSRRCVYVLPLIGPGERAEIDRAYESAYYRMLVDEQEQQVDKE